MIRFFKLLTMFEVAYLDKLAEESSIIKVSFTIIIDILSNSGTVIIFSLKHSLPHLYEWCHFLIYIFLIVLIHLANTTVKILFCIT